MAQLLDPFDKATLKELKDWNEQGLIDDEQLQKLRAPILDKIMHKVQELGGSKRNKGTPASAQLAGSSSPSESSSASDVSPASYSSERSHPATAPKATIHAMLKPEVPQGKKLKKVHNSCHVKGKQNSLYSFGVTTKRKMLDGSSVVINDDGNAFIEDRYEDCYKCDTCQRTFSWAPALKAHQKTHIAAKPMLVKAEEMVIEEKVRLFSAPVHDGSARISLSFVVATTSRPETSAERHSRLAISADSAESLAEERKRNREIREAEEVEEEMEEGDADVEVEDEHGESLLGRRGSEKRSARSFLFKRKVLRKLKEYEDSRVPHPMKMAAARFGIHKSCVTLWKKKAEYIFKQCMNRKATAMTQRQPKRQSGKWKDVQRDLASWIRDNRKEGKSVSMLAVRLQCKKIFMQLRPDEYQDFKCSRHMLDNFLSRAGFAIRRRTNGKSQSVDARVNGIKRFHARLRMRLRTDQEKTGIFDVKWGAYRPANRYSIDQVPLPLCNPSTTIDEKGAKRVWIGGTKNDDSQKRFCTLQVAVRLTNQKMLSDGSIKSGTAQPKLTFCFRGKGLRITQQEKEAWHPGVNVQFQDKAWCAEAQCIDYAIKHFSEDVKEVPGTNLVFLDNLDGQTRPSFQKAMKEACNSACHFLTAGATDEIQVVDGGVGKEIKREIVALTEKRLIEDTAFFEQWSTGGLCASEKRIFLTHVGYQAHQNVMARFDVEKVGTRTGCLMTINGVGDPEIKPQGLPAYSFCPADADLPVQNKKGDFNDVAEENEAGLIGDEEEIFEDSGGEEEEEEHSSSEEEEVLLVSKIISCQYVGPTIKYVCQYRGYEDDDTSLEPSSNIQPKSVLLDFQKQGQVDGTFPPEKPALKRKGAPNNGPNKKAKSAAGSSSNRVTRGSTLHFPTQRELDPDNLDDVDEEATAVKEPKVAVKEAIDLCDSDASPLKAPRLEPGICDYGCPDHSECLLPHENGRICGEPGCNKRVHHLCLIEYSENPKKPMWYKKFVDKWPSSAMCKRHCVKRVAMHERESK